jgi:Right handed beta helix region
MGSTRVLEARYFLAALLGVLVAVLVLMGLQAKPASAATCTDSLQTKINAASSGGTVTANPCVYREQITITKPITLKGQSGSEIRGSDVWTGWTKSGSYWKSSKAVPSLPAPTLDWCETGTKRCTWPEQVFFDGKPLEQVASNPTTGQFALDANRRVLLADDPTGHTVEVSTRPQWVVGKSGGVTVEGFTMKHAANDRQRNGAIANKGYSNWTIRNNILSDAHSSVVNLSEASGLKLVGNNISRSGQLGATGGQGSLVVQNNKIHHNNTEAFNPWRSGGAKFGKVTSLTASGNEIYANEGPGLWCDMDCTNVVFSNNRIHHNERMGINFEISSGAKIFDNVLWENGWGKPGWGWGAGIVSSSSKNVEIYSNTLAWNADGISVISQDREAGAGGTEYDLVTGVSVHDNTILAKDYYPSSTTNNFGLAWLQDWAGGVLYLPTSNNLGANNLYWYTTAEGSYIRFKHESSYKKLSEFNPTLGEEKGRYLTKTEKDAVVADKNIPANPESH